MHVNPNYDLLGEAMYEAICAASTALPADVEAALKRALDVETDDGCRSALRFILDNVALARAQRTPICQDTGYPAFLVDLPAAWDKRKVHELLLAALRQATADAVMRPNSIHALTGKNSGDNTGILCPAVHFEENDGQALTLRVLLKGGGSENVSTQYRLPHAPLRAGRDLKGVEKVALDGIFQAQGFGCAPGIIGVAIGGDRAQSYALAKQQLLRPLSDVNPDPKLAELESRLLDKANALGIGAMGFGGRTTVLGVKAAAAHRHPACFFVTIAYGCWALRRKTLSFHADGRYTITD
jgi:fumarate hydratase class I